MTVVASRCAHAEWFPDMLAVMVEASTEIPPWSILL